MPDYYDILEVSHDATAEQIRRSYHKLALKYHPDKAGPEGAAKIREVNAAYEVLSDPQKKSVYDKYGEAGVNAMDNPAMGPAVSAVGPCVAATVLLGTAFLVGAMVVLFLSFLAAHVDGNLRSWNYVKVFSPLFVIDGLLGIPAIFLMLFLPCALQGPSLLASMAYLLCFACLIILSIVIPIAKDRNEERAADGRTDFLQWRVWLIPGYLFSVFFFIGMAVISWPSYNRRVKNRAFGMRVLAEYLPVSFVIRLLAACCVPVLFALVACRADEIIMINYFIVIGLPCYVFGGLLILDIFLEKVLRAFLFVADEGQDDVNEKDKNGRTVCACYHVCGTVFGLMGIMLFFGMLFATVSMLCVRLNHMSWYGNYDDVPSLGKTLIPIFIMVGLVVIPLFVTTLMLCCCGMDIKVENEGGNDSEEGGNVEDGQGGADNAGGNADATTGNGVPHRSPKNEDAAAAPEEHRPESNCVTEQAQSHNVSGID